MEISRQELGNILQCSGMEFVGIFKDRVVGLRKLNGQKRGRGVLEEFAQTIDRHVKRLREEFECPICYEVCNSYNHCLNGHLVCKNCYRHMRHPKECPVCRHRIILEEKVLSRINMVSLINGLDGGRNEQHNQSIISKIYSYFFSTK